MKLPCDRTNYADCSISPKIFGIYVSLNGKVAYAGALLKAD